MQVLGLVEIRLAEDFSSEGAWEWEIRTILVKSMDLAVIWLNKFLSGEFRGKVVIIWSNLQILRLLGRINSFLENFVFFTESGHLCLWVSPLRFDGNVKCDRTKFIYRLGCFLQVKWYEVCAKKNNKLIVEFVRVG